MKNLLLVIVLLSLLISVGCTNDAVDTEIKSIVKDLPVPTRYDPSNGKLLVFDKIVVAQSNMSRSEKYDKRTGEDITLYSVYIRYKDSVVRSRLFAKTEELQQSFGYYLTLGDIRNNAERLYWD